MGAAGYSEHTPICLGSRSGVRLEVVAQGRRGSSRLPQLPGEEVMSATCACGMWPIEEYGERCPSCPDFSIVSKDGCEWATAHDYANAMFGAGRLAFEERQKFIILDPAGKQVGVVIPMEAS
jgi:hypothetical protein